MSTPGHAEARDAPLFSALGPTNALTHDDAPRTLPSHTMYESGLTIEWQVTIVKPAHGQERI